MKKAKIKKIIYTLFLLLINIFLLFGIFIPYVKDKIRERRILNDMSSIYINADFLEVKCDKTPIDITILKDNFMWYGKGEGITEDLYCFIILDSEEKVGTGYANEKGEVVLDSYAGYYYREDALQYFLDVTDFENNFPGVHYFAATLDPINENRLVLSHECKTFEDYKRSRIVGFMWLSSYGYPGIYLGLEKTDKETITKINELLEAADFDMYIMYCEISGDFDNAKETLDLYWDDPEYEYDEEAGYDGCYLPFGKSYKEAILGED